MIASGNARAGRGRAHSGQPPQLGEARRATIEDVARQAEVSVSAVSKVLRDAYGVSPQMRTKVTAAIERLGYRPHAGARAMRGSTYTIGVMISDLAGPFQSEILQGLSGELETSQYQEIAVVGGNAAERQQRRIESLVDRQVDGLILIVPAMSQEWLEKLGGSVPTVVIARHGGGASYDAVVDDDYEGAQLMVDHLVSLGHRRILHTTHPSGDLQRPFVLSHTARCDGYLNAMKRHQLKTDVIETTYTEQGGYQAAREALARSIPPTAIFAGADIAALGVLRATEELGLRVPEDVTVTGYDNIYVSTIGRIALTTVDQAGRRTGSIGAKLLLDRINGRVQPVQHIIAPRLIPRGTSGPPPRQPADVSARPRRRSAAKPR